MSFGRGFYGLLAGVLLAGLCGCVYESDPAPYSQQGGSPAPTPPPSTGGGGTTGTGASANPVLVSVDPGKTMTATPGQGVGVFVEYRTGGHWHVWWTCDTTTTGQSCSFDVKVSLSTGALTNTASQEFGANDTLLTPSAQAIEATTTTSTSLSGITFDSPAGGTITLEPTVDGQHFIGTSSGATSGFIFFSQNGQVNGGYTGTLTNPLLMVGSSP